MSGWQRQNYKARFVSASSSSSSKNAEEMSNVPPPMELTQPNAVAMREGYRPNVSTYAGMSQRDMERKKEEEYNALVYGGGKKEPQERKKRIYEDEYLEKDEDDDCPYRKESPERQQPGDEEEEDDLDAFMAGINAQASKDKAVSIQKDLNRGHEKAADEKDKKKGLGRADIDDEDMQESYFKFLEENKTKYGGNEDEDKHEYDEDGNIIFTWKKVIDPLPAINHSEIKYLPFHKNFYNEHDDIKALTYPEVMKLRETIGLSVGGPSVPKPVCSFAHFGFEKQLLETVRKAGYEQPTPIQAQAVPAAMSGRDVLGIAKTGSGKTAAYLWPAIVHVMDQPDLKPGQGPIALVVVPTRELAIQVFTEARKLCRPFNVNVICAYGGGSKWEQQNELQGEGAEIVVCTPGRIIDLVKLGATNFERTTFLVFDEADRMFDMGFEAQVKSISDHIRPDRQCLMFSATFKNKVERLAREALNDPVRIVHGEVGEANSDIVQTVEVLPSQEAKWNWLMTSLVQFASVGKVLVFVTKKADSEYVAKKLAGRDFRPVLLHGDMQQSERNEVLQRFRKQANIMVATDVAARGLDIPEIRTVINYDLARDIDTHVHRVGRTGRAGQRGWAYTLVVPTDMEMAGHLVRNLESVNQQVPKTLVDLAMKAAWFRSSRRGDGSAGQTGQAKFGLGYKPKQRAPTGFGAGKERDPLKESRPTRSVQETVADAQKKMFTGAVQGGSGAGGGVEGGTGGGAGPVAQAGNSRLAAMRNAFKSSFGHQFHAASADSQMSAPVASDPRPEWKRKADEISQMIAAGITPGQQPPPPPPPSSDGASQQKRSRWQ